MTLITQGRVIPESDAERDAERVKAELDNPKFARAMARFQRMLAQYVRERFTGNARCSVKFRDGRAVAVQFNPDDEIRLDAESP